MPPLEFLAAGEPAAKRDEYSALVFWFQQEIQVHEPDLRAYLRSRFSDVPDPDDILQDCYTRLVRLRENGPIPVTRAYLFVVVRNAAVDFIRRRKVVPLEPLDESAAASVADERHNAADQLCHEEELQLLDRAIGDLPPRCREILVLFRLHRLSYREIARRLGISESTVHVQLCLAMKKCRHFLADHGVTKARLDAPSPA